MGTVELFCGSFKVVSGPSEVCKKHQFEHREGQEKGQSQLVSRFTLFIVE